MVGIGESPARDIPSAVPVQMMKVEEYSHELRYGDRRVRIVQLDRHLVRQFVKIRVIFGESEENILERSADEEVLLLEPQLASHFRGIIWIEHFGKVF